MAKLQTRDLLVVMDPSEHGEGGEHLVTVRMVDQLVAELEGKRHGVDAVRSPIHLQALFGWAAMVREGKFSGKFPAFRDACVAVEDTDPDGDGDDVPPTTSAAPTA